MLLEKLFVKFQLLRNPHFSYAYNLFAECYIYDFDFEEGKLCLM